MEVKFLNKKSFNSLMKGKKTITLGKQIILSEDIKKNLPTKLLKIDNETNQALLKQNIYDDENMKMKAISGALYTKVLNLYIYCFLKARHSF